jgi:hypothetical protein
MMFYVVLMFSSSQMNSKNPSKTLVKLTNFSVARAKDSSNTDSGGTRGKLGGAELP